MVAMIVLYLRAKAHEVDNLTEELNLLSLKLCRRAEILGIEHDEKNRNLSGMKMILENVKSVDTGGEDGLPNAANVIREILELHRLCPAVFKRICDSFNAHYSGQ